MGLNVLVAAVVSRWLPAERTLTVSGVSDTVNRETELPGFSAESKHSSRLVSLKLADLHATSLAKPIEGRFVTLRAGCGPADGIVAGLFSFSHLIGQELVHDRPTTHRNL
jgi:hypothetical protein